MYNKVENSFGLLFYYYVYYVYWSNKCFITRMRSGSPKSDCLMNGSDFKVAVIAMFIASSIIRDLPWGVFSSLRSYKWSNAIS